MNRRLITDYDYERLDSILETASMELMRSDIFKEFSVELLSAQILPQKSISSRVITMNTRVLLRELASKKEVEVTITYPNEAKSHERKVSVFSQIGISLLGRKLGDIVSWSIPGGIGRFEIIDVTYQPEAVGDYHL